VRKFKEVGQKPIAAKLQEICVHHVPFAVEKK